MRRRLFWTMILIVSVTSASLASEARQAAATKQKGSRSAKTPPAKRFDSYQVPAGTTLPIELRTRLTSNGNQQADIVEGRLLRALETPEGVELVPAGASVLGTVTEAEAAGVRKPGRLAFTFNVVEHPDSGSRATIKASVLTFASQPPLKGNLFADVLLEKGSDASVLLLAPLVVRIPVN